MKKIFLVIILVLSGWFSYSQSLKKYPISNSGCSVYNYCEISYDVSKSQDSSTVYNGECVKDEINYGVICVKLHDPVSNLPEAEDMMISYVDYLKTTLKITKSAGYGKGHRLNNNENTRGVIDYWGDDEKNNWKIKAWTDGKFIGVLFAYSKKELPETKINLFLDGFRLPY